MKPATRTSFPAVSCWLIAMNTLLFLAMRFSGAAFDDASLLRWGANYYPLVTEGQWWRLFSSMFLHQGWLHLAVNMGGLLVIGLLLERRLGAARFTLAYLVTGLAASLCSAWWHKNAVSAGASGAVFGLYGVFLLLFATPLFPVAYRSIYLLFIGLFIAVNLLLGAVVSHIDNAAHAAGFISGMITGYCYRAWPRKT